MGLTLSFLLNISITSLSEFVLKAKYSVTPLYLPFKKVFFEIGPLIRANELLSFSKFKPISKDLFI